MADTNLDTAGNSLNTPQKFSFHGNGGEFFLLAIKVTFLTIFTFGIYWFWGNVRITKFFYTNTKFQGFTFDYHATGKEKFIGFLKAFGVLLLVGIANGLIAWVLGKILGPSLSQFITVGIFYLALFGVIPFLIIGALRFRLSRTSFNGVRFQFLGEPREFTELFLKSVGLTVITLGIYTPWALVAIATYITRNSLYGNHAFDLRVKAEELFFTFLKGFFLSIVTAGIYSFWFRANLHNFFWNNYYFQNGKTISSLTGGKLFITFLKSIGLFLISFGFAAPYVFLLNKKVIIENLGFSTSIDFESIASIPIKSGSATIESLGGDALDSFGSIVG